jgi:nucleoside-diphosphate-sugar epimerase
MDKNTKILVTGASGMVGSYIVRNLLLEGYVNITGCRRESSNLEYIGDFINTIDWVVLDILDPMVVFQTVKHAEVVIHTAAAVDFQGQFERLYKVNVEGTATLVNAALEANVKKFVYISSTAALGRKSRKNIIDENTEWEYSKYNTDYAISKYHAELEVWRGVAEGLKAVVLNPSFILGTGDWNKSSLQLIKKIDAGIWLYPSGSNGFVDVRDVAKSVFLALKDGVIGERYIISAENSSYKKIIDLIAKELEKKPPSLKLPYTVGYIGGKLGDLVSIIKPNLFPVNMDIIRNLYSDNNYLPTKSIDGLGMDYISIEQSVEDVVNAYRNTGIKILKF